MLGFNNYAWMIMSWTGQGKSGLNCDREVWLGFGWNVNNSGYAMFGMFGQGTSELGHILL